MNLKEYLQSRNISHQEFADMIGVSQTAVTKYVNKQRGPILSIAMKIVQATRKKVTLQDLMRNKEKE